MTHRRLVPFVHLLPALLLACLTLAAVGVDAPPATSDEPAAAFSSRSPADVVVIELEGEINDFNRDSLRTRFDAARELGVGTVIVEIDSYGGLVTSGLDISRFLKRQSDLHTIAFVRDKAISAGAMVAVACNELVMSPHSQIGDSGVIAMAPGGGLQELGETERAKFESPVLEDFRDSAQRNGYPPAVLAAMVNVARTVHWVQAPEPGEGGTFERRFVDTPTYTTLLEQGWRPVEGVPDPIDGPDSLLMLSADLADTLGVSRGTYPDVETFAASRGLNVVATLRPTSGERLLGWLNSHALRGIVTAVFMFSVYMAFTQPGTGMPEALLVSSLAVLLGVPLLTGHAQWYEVVAVLLGVGLLAVEVFVLPGFGVAGLTGLLLVTGGLAATFVGPVKLPGLPMFYGVPTHAIRDALATVVLAMAGSLVVAAFVARFLPQSPMGRRGLVLTTTVGSTPEPTRADRSRDVAEEVGWPAVGALGTAATDLRPGGAASFLTGDAADYRTIDVVSDRGYVRVGTPLVVRDNAGGRVVVRETADIAAGPRAGGAIG